MPLLAFFAIVAHRRLPARHIARGFECLSPPAARPGACALGRLVFVHIIIEIDTTACYLHQPHSYC